MMREYDLYESMTDGSFTWRGFARGADAARRRLRILSNETGHRCFGIYGPSKKVISVSPGNATR